MNLDETQTKMLNEWNEKHFCEFKDYSSAIGGRLTYCYTPTSLGMIIVIRCECGDKIDVTNYENW